jgi:hypothetical protein
VSQLSPCHGVTGVVRLSEGASWFTRLAWDTVTNVTRTATQLLPDFPHRAFAAFRAISLRFAAESAFALAGPPARPPIRAMSDSRSGVRFLARARPPFGPPSLPRATACGFFLRGMGNQLLYGTGLVEP